MSRFRSLRREDGSVIAIVAITLPVFLLLAALVVDVGDWYSHKRQLQNRADAGALAAGAAYGKYWAACIGPAGAAQTNALNAITIAARQYAGDPNPYPASGAPVYNPVSTPPVNTEIAGQNRLNVVLNSTSYDAGTDGSDGGDPCTKHAADGTSAAGYWTDVRVKEVNVPSLFGAVGLDLPKVGARARVAIRPAISDRGFVPLAVPDNRIVKAQARFFNDCTGAQIGPAVTLAPLDSSVGSNPSVAGTTLWVPDMRSPAPVPATPVSSPATVSLQLPSSSAGTGCGGTANDTQDYIPVSVEVRVAGQPNIDLNQSCSTLQSANSADCFHDLTEIRAYVGGNTDQRPVINSNPGVTFSPSAGSAGCLQDPYYARLQAGQSSCTYDASINLDWGNRPGPGTAFTATLRMSGSNTDYPLARPSGTPPNGVWVASGIPLSAIGARDVQLRWGWSRTSGTWAKTSGTVTCTNGNNNPCDQSANKHPLLTIHRVSLGDDPSGNTEPTADVVSMVELQNGPSLASQLASVPATGNAISTYLFVGLKSALTPGQFVVLREGNPQGNQSLICDPAYTGGKTFEMFRDGCNPPYGVNSFTDPAWWVTATQHCPAQGGWFQSPTNGVYPKAPWRCIPTLPGGHGNQVTDGLAVRIGVCNGQDPNPLNNSRCQAHNYQCNVGHEIKYVNADTPVEPSDQRIIKVYVIPYGALKSTSGNDEIPVLDFAAFYVTAFASGNDKEPCAGNDNAKLPSSSTAVVGGYFLRFVEPSGPVDPTATCDPNQIRPCRAVLER